MIKVCVSGFFNPLHIGHLAYIKAAKSLGDHLTVIVNNDKQVALKGSVPFMDEEARLQIISALKDVDEVILAVDEDRSVAETLKIVKPTIFCNGGDVSDIGAVNAKEIEVCRAINCEILLGVGGRTKIESSSRLKSVLPTKENFEMLNRMMVDEYNMIECGPEIEISEV